MNPTPDTPPAGFQPDRRTLLKAATATGIVWASPFVHSVTAHAACVGSRVQFFFNGATMTPTDSSLDYQYVVPADTDCAGAVPPCEPAGVDSLGGALIWDTTTNHTGPAGTLSGTQYSQRVYTAPTGCVIADATMQIFNPNASGCAARYQCGTTTTGDVTINNTTTPSTATFAAQTSPEYGLIYRIILCCTS